MYEIVKNVDEETITKGNIVSLKRDHTTSLQSDSVEEIGEINNKRILLLLTCPPAREVCLNHKMVVFKPPTGTSPDPGSVAIDKIISSLPLPT